MTEPFWHDPAMDLSSRAAQLQPQAHSYPEQKEAQEIISLNRKGSQLVTSLYGPLSSL